MDSTLALASDWIQRLVQESDDEVLEQTRWPILPMLPDMRKVMWSLCASLGVNSKGVPGNACRLMERYLSRHLKKYSQTIRDSEEWDRYKQYMATQFCLLMASCLQLSAKMCTSSTPLSVAKVKAVLLAKGYEHTGEEIKQKEFHVYSTLDFRLPLWTSLETADFLARQVAMTTDNLLTAIELVTELTEYNRYHLELHMQCWHEVCNSSEAPTTSRQPRLILRNLHVCAGAVVAAAEYMNIPSHDQACELATLTRTTPAYLKAIAKTIYNHIITDRQYIPILKRRRFN